MIKLNKTTHLMILFTFAVIFVVVYLYYTINDVKRINNEMKRLTTDVSKLNQDVINVIATINGFNKDEMCMTKQNMNTPLVPKSTDNQLTTPIAQASLIQSSIVDDIAFEDEDDDTSVNTEELKHIIADNDIEDHEEVCELEAPETEKDLEPTSTLSNIEELRKLKYDDVKELCKQKGISIKGTKEQLITKLSVVS